MEKLLEKISFQLQYTIENELRNNFGICYLIGHVMTRILNELGHEANEVTGSFAVICSNNKYITYGNRKIKGLNVGDYHTWCEVKTKEGIYIVDPSLKFNKVGLKKYYSKKIHGKVPDAIICKKENNFYYKYITDDSLVKFSKEYLAKVDEKLIQKIVDYTIKNL